MKTKILIGLIILIFLGAGAFFGRMFLPSEEEIQDCIYSKDYDIKLIMPTAFGLPAQFALLPNGDMAIGDFANNRILLFHNNKFEIVVAEDINAWAVAALPDGRLAYAKNTGKVMVFDYQTKQEESLGRIPGIPIPGGRYPQALASDKQGNVYLATSRASLFRFKNGQVEKIVDSLPFPNPDSVQITDIAIGLDGTVYVAGFEKVFAIDSNGNIQTIAEGLNYEPVWVEVAPDGMLYINELSSGLQRFDPKTKEISQLKVRYGFGDMLALTADELFFYDSRGAFYALNLQTNTIKPLYARAGNSPAFAADADGNAFFATPLLESVLKQHMVKINSNGERVDLRNLEYMEIFAADVDNENRLTLLTDEGVIRLNHDGSIKLVPIRIEGREFPNMGNFAAGLKLWYVITTDHNEKIEVFSVDELGGIKFLPISFSHDSFGTEVYKVSDARIDVAPDGSLALIVTARGSASRGPFLQRVYRADADGSNLKEIARLDSPRVAGLVDIAVSPDNKVFVLTNQGEAMGGSDSIYRIDENNKAAEAIHICNGHDPQSIDIDSAGNIWFSTTIGIFKATIR
jgi:streptogramin lyase